ncbi:hypothetical protein LTR66_004561 [Elasticomyces elasticus]|nr:hypothetical protein LTR66_004561 [Elasticomyces elasticus]
MASFFPPASFSPLVSTGGPPRFEVFSNSTLGGVNFFTYWYQHLVLVLGVISFAVLPLTWLIRFLQAQWKRRRLGPSVGPRANAHSLPKAEIDISDKSTQATLGSIKSFGFYVGARQDLFLQQHYDLHIVSLRGTKAEQLHDSPVLAAQTLDTGPTPERTVYGFIESWDWQHQTLIEAAGKMDDLRRHQGCAGLVLLPKLVPNAREFNPFLGVLCQKQVNVVVMTQPDDPLIEYINFNLVAGVIFLNACVLPNGLRRDFFQAAQLREGIGRCLRQKKTRPDFFMGFFDLWDTRPNAATVKRAQRVADFHSTTIHIRPRTSITRVEYSDHAKEVCLSGFDQLKKPEIIELQRVWTTETKPIACHPSHTSVASMLDTDSLRHLLPSIDSLLQLFPVVSNSDRPTNEASIILDPPSFAVAAPPRPDFWTTSSYGEKLCSLGCYELREAIYMEQYEAVLKTQKHLRRLDMLHKYQESEVEALCKHLEPCGVTQHFKLLQLLISGLRDGRVAVYKGLDSGFTLPENGGHLWGVSEDLKHAQIAPSTIIYVSQKAVDVPGTILHTYLAHMGIPRLQRFEEELRLRQCSSGIEVAIPARIESELETSSPGELLFLLQQFRISGLQHPMITAIEGICRRQLIEESSTQSWVEQHSRGYLNGSVSMRTLLKTRLEWYALHGATELPAIDRLLELFTILDEMMSDALFEADRTRLATLSSVLFKAYDWGQQDAYVDTNVDLFALMFFCVLRKLAFEDVYLETTDRCPFFLTQPDQAAVFAELWVLGSQCEIYFNILPRTLGNIVYDKYRSYLRQYPPPANAFNGVDVFTAYASVESPKLIEELGPRIGIGIEEEETRPSWRKRLAKFGSLSVFCVPAIVDVLLLTFLGRGLYLTAFMDTLTRTMANYALLTALLITAGVTGWVGSTGGFYLYNYAFDNMNHFLVQRLSGGFVLSVVVSVCGFIAFGFQYSWYGGFVYVAYLMAISTYLNLLGIMATMHRDGSPLRSGRAALAKCMVVLLISPILTTFVNGHDILVYMIVIWAFIVLLLFTYRNICHEWSSWLEKVPNIKEKQIVDWYEARPAGHQTPTVTETKATGSSASAARAALQHEVAEARSKRSWLPWSKATDDSLVSRWALGYDNAIWLLEKESGGAPLPEIFTATWLVQLDLAVKNQQQLQRGLKEHSPFIMFRYSKYDLGQNVGLFLIALLDRWVAITMSARQPQINLYADSRARYGIAFGLLYFLTSAIAVDALLQRYWSQAAGTSKERLLDLLDSDIVGDEQNTLAKRRWVHGFSELLNLMLMIFGVTTILVWLFVINYNEIILYFTYVIAYTGLVIFQFNRPFTTDTRRHVLVVFCAAFAGFFLGCMLHAVPQTAGFRYNDVIALNTASLSAAFGTWLLTDFGTDPSWNDLTTEVGSPNTTNWKLYSQKMIGSDSSRLSKQPEKLFALDSTVTTVVQCNDRSSVALRITSALEQAQQRHDRYSDIFPRSREILELTLNMWTRHESRVVIVSRETFVQDGFHGEWALGDYHDGSLTVYAGFMPEDTVVAWLENKEDDLAQILVEALLHETSEAVLRLSHQHATLSELLLSGSHALSRRMSMQLEMEKTGRLDQILRRTNIQIMKHLCFGIDVDTQWNLVPEDVRKCILSRILGYPFQTTKPFAAWMNNHGKDVLLDNLSLGQCLAIYKKVSVQLNSPEGSPFDVVDFRPTHEPALLKVTKPRPSQRASIFVKLGGSIKRAIYNVVQYVAIISGAGSDAGRELWYTLRKSKHRRSLLWILLKIWKVCWWNKNFWTTMILVKGTPQLKTILKLARQGVPRTLRACTITIEDPQKTVSGFLTKDSAGQLNVRVFNGLHTTPPDNVQAATVAKYDNKYRLRELQSFPTGKENQPVKSEFMYDPSSNTRWPVSKSITEEGRVTTCFYDKYGRIECGDIFCGKKQFRFTYIYKKRPKGNSDVLEAVYECVEPGSEVKYSVFWCVLPKGSKAGEAMDVKDWIPSNNITRLVITTAGKMLDTTWVYHHKRDPELSTLLIGKNGQRIRVDAPPEARKDELGFLKKPRDLSFDSEDLLIYHPRIWLRNVSSRPSASPFDAAKFTSRLATYVPFGWSYWSKKTVYRKITTSRLRSVLWKQWTTATNLDAVSACLIDELVLREEPLLGKYWSFRDSGYFKHAKDFLDENLEFIIPTIEVAHDVSQQCSLIIKPSDLFTMGLSKDANQITNRPEDCYHDTDNRVSVIFTDTGCWPDAPGGVSNCRRDLVNGHTTVRNHVLAEAANDYGIPRYQVERNIQSLKVLPLWGLDGKTPYHGLFDNLLQSQIDERINDTDIEQDVVATFIPLLEAFVKGARTKRYTRADLAHYTNVILNINSYFEQKDYNKTWRAKEVQIAWRRAWLYPHDDPNVLDPSEYFEIERPSMTDFQGALELYICYFFIFSVNVPDTCPRVFQSTHHGISSLYGLILKYRKGTTWGIWDHAIMWRESCLNVSPAQCTLPIPVQSMLLAGMKLAAHLAYNTVDVILPCTSVFNPTWEADLGTDQGRLGSKKIFHRKIDPIVNGISNMDSFKPVDKITSELPTTIMLSNVQFIKDVKNAVMAADVIINQFGFHDYRLKVYGAQDRQPSYALDTERIISTRGLAGKVMLAGFGSAKEVLKEAWLFMNSSLSEGLPLAIGEAALAGTPIVATEVGATALVLTDPDNPAIRYGEVVPPNDPVALARAQLSLLAMLGPWAKYTHDETPPPPLPDFFTPEDVKWITKRMYDRTEDRRALGLKLRGIILRNFHGDRYLREHEQMYWIHRHMSEQRSDEDLNGKALRNPRFGQHPLPALEVEKTYGTKRRNWKWQNFEVLPRSHVSLRDKFSAKLGAGSKRSRRSVSRIRSSWFEMDHYQTIDHLEAGRSGSE